MGKKEKDKKEKKGIENFSLSQLREVCDQKNITFKSSDSKEDLISKIQKESDKTIVEKDPKNSRKGEH
jgi:hypothetical protein